MARKVFISVLGYSNYGKCFYTRKSEGFKSDEVRYVQEATLQYLMSVSEWTKADCAYILLTKGAEQKIGLITDRSIGRICRFRNGD